MAERFHCIVFLLLVVFIASCSSASSYLITMTDRMDSFDFSLNNYEKVIIIPGTGCPGCISKAEDYFRHNYQDKSSLFLFTNILSRKGLDFKMKGIALEDLPNVIIDDTNHFFIENELDNEFPMIINVKEGKMVKIKPL